MKLKNKTAAKHYTVPKSRTGLGLFAAREFKRGSFVVEYTGKKVLTAHNQKRPSKIQRYQFEINSKWTLDGYSKTNIARYINHSCNPNTEACSRDKVLIRALREISPGEEFTIDYGSEYFDEFIRPYGCKCVSCDKIGV